MMALAGAGRVGVVSDRDLVVGKALEDRHVGSDECLASITLSGRGNHAALGCVRLRRAIVYWIPGQARNDERASGGGRVSSCPARPGIQVLFPAAPEVDLLDCRASRQ